MAIDTSIYQNLLRPAKSVEDYNNEAMQQKQNRLALLLQQGKVDDYQRERAGESKLAELLANGGTPDQVGAGLAQAGYGKQALAYTKQQQEIAKSQADIGHIGAQTGKLKTETTNLDYDLREKKRQKAVTDIASFTSPEQAHASLALHEQAGDIAPKQAALIRQTIPANPADFPRWQVGMLQRIMSAKDASAQIAPDANARLSSQTQITTNGATNATSRANNAATVGATLRGQNLTDARAREQLEAGKNQVVQSDAGPVLVNTKTGAGKPLIGPDGQPLGPKLKDIPASVNTAMITNTQTLAQLDRTIALLEGKNKDGQTGDNAATGLKGYLPQQMLNALDPKGIDARAGVADIGSLKLHDRSGAAVTASESPRLMPFIPTSTDTNETALKKLKRLRLETANETEALGETYGKSAGYKPNPVIARTNNPVGGVPDDIAALIKKHGGK